MATKVPATVFLNQRWMSANPRDTEFIVSHRDVFDVGNHGTAHRPLSVTGKSAYGIAGTKSVAEAVDEVMGNHETLTRLLGTPPRYFRTGTAWYDDVALEVVRLCGEIAIGFDVNGDQGATLDAGDVATQVRTATPGSIIICHMNHPSSGTRAGLQRAIPELRATGRNFGRLSDCGVG